MIKKFPPLLAVAIMVLTLAFVNVAPVAAESARGFDRANAQAKTRMMREAKPSVTPSPALLQACQARQAAVTTRMSQLVRMTENMLQVFDAHAARVQEFYLTKAVPAGFVVANYDALVANIAANKAVVQTAIANAQADVDDFTCLTDSPAVYFTSYRENMQEVKSALKNFRTSIKNLIVAVRTAAEDLEEEASPTPSPSVSPSPTVTPSPSPSPTI